LGRTSGESVSPLFFFLDRQCVNERTNFRIVLTGPLGSGKTTLGLALSKRLGLPLLPEDMTSIVSFMGRMSMLRQHGAPPQEFMRLNKAWMKAHIDWVLARKRQYAKLEGFVADRWEADILSFWLVIFGQYYPDVQTKLIFDQMIETSKKIDLVVRLPMASFDFESQNDDGLMRRAQLTIQLLYDSSRDGLMGRCANLKIFDIPEGNIDVEERCNLIIKNLPTST
jgi:adenylate kinase family enzyme